MSQESNAESPEIFRTNLFADKVAIVTGGASGIGLTTARQLLRLGAKVAICGRDPKKLARCKSELDAQFGGNRVHTAPCDIRESEVVNGYVSQVLETFGAIDILFNNAGGQFPAPAQAISPKGFHAVVRNNLCGTFNMTHAVANQFMIPHKSGCIVNMIANIYRGFPGMAHTGAARAGVENLTMTLAVEWSRFNIQVNAIAPGIIVSSGTERYPQEILEKAIESCPAKRPGTTEEVAAAVLYLCSPAARYVTGTTLRIDGGHALRGDTFPL